MASNPTIASQVSLFNNTPHLQRPQSLKIASQTAVPLQSLQLQQPTSLFETATRFVALQSANRNQHTVEKSTQDEKHQHELIFNNLDPNADITCKKQRHLSKQHPQIWCGKGNTEPTATKHVYNYAHKKEANEKTPMCQIAELARYNKLKHEYVLLDESGPAHKKKFTVKLILCEGNEFEGSGPSIKKAQQSAAKCALESTNLPKPSQVKSIRRPSKKDESGNLLISVASQLGINVHYREEQIYQPSNSLTPVPVLSISPTKPTHSIFLSPPIISPNYYPQTTLFTPPNQHLQNKNGLASILDYTLASNQYNNTNTTLPLVVPFTPISIFNNALMSRFSIPPATSYLNGWLVNKNIVGQSSVQNVIYKVIITLSSDGTQHVGIGSNQSSAKQRATIKALNHLKPELEKFKHNNESNISEQQLHNKQRELSIEDQRNQLFVSDVQTSNTDQSSSGSPDYKNEDENLEMLKDIESVLLSQNVQPIDRLSRQRRKAKSVVSQIHEYALRLRMNIEFEVLAETGEPHSRLYILRCRLTAPRIPNTDPNFGTIREYTAEGQGPSKKAAKQAACIKLLDQVRRLLDDDPVLLATEIVRQASGTDMNKNGKSNKDLQGKRRTIIKDKKMDPEYGHHINPVSRLIQIMQARQEKEPQFHLISEHGQNRHKEFTVSVRCMDLHELGIGPNKKLAKRAAAEAMLARIGYVKPMPQPGKSLLKKKTDQNDNTLMDIGHFDPNMLTEDGENKNDYVSVAKEDFKKQQCSEQQTMFDAMIETFADVEIGLKEEIMDNDKTKKEATRTNLDDGTESTCNDKSNQNCNNSSVSTNTDDANLLAIRSQRRRVTFSEHVSACPPPEDSNYPAASIAPLKLDLGVRMKRRSRDSQRVLALEETKKLREAAKLFLRWQNGTKDKKGLINLQADDWNWNEMHGLDLLVGDCDSLTFTAQNIRTGTNALKGTEQPLINQPKHQNVFGNDSAILPSPPAPFLASPLHPLLPALTFPTSIIPPTEFDIPPLVPTSLLANTTNPSLLPPPITKTSVSTVNTKESNSHQERQSNFALIGAKDFLENLAKHFKFTVAYSDFPKTKNVAGEEQCFSLLTVGLAKPIVCHGSGPTEIHAHNDAAYNAIRNSLSQIN